MSSAEHQVLGPPQDAVAPDGPHVGDTLGHYQLLARVGAGGMGRVFKAVHVAMQRVVAVKVMAGELMSDTRARARFLREVHSVTRLNHPHIVAAYDAAVEGQWCYLVLEFVDGRDAAALLAECGPPPVHVACEIIRQAALGLHHAHENGMLHRDLKPGNLIVSARRSSATEILATANGGPHVLPKGWPADPSVKILDFGLVRAKCVDSPSTLGPGITPLTREGYVVGTPEFMSPEQASESRHTDVRSDIYGLGCTFYCLLTGRPPFVGHSLVEILMQHMLTVAEPVRRARPEVPRSVAAVLEKMIAKNPADRFASAAEVAEALDSLGRGDSLREIPNTPAALASPDSTTAGVTSLQPSPVPARPTYVIPKQRRKRSPVVVVVKALWNVGTAMAGCLLLFLLLLATMVAGLIVLQARFPVTNPTSHQSPNKR
jgi:eukaryotic-like serine/threonine-protein kinase